MKRFCFKIADKCLLNPLDDWVQVIRYARDPRVPRPILSPERGWTGRKTIRPNKENA